MKKLLTAIIATLLLTSCSGPDRLALPELSDAGSENEPYDPESFDCDPNNEERLQADIRNCGECGNACTRSTSDQCVAGECLCGGGPPCGPGAECIHGRCIEADVSVCETSEDCSMRQSCIPSIDGNSYCLEVCEFDDVCADGYYCIEGTCTFVDCVPENCDGLDNDCDGVVDESDSGGPLSKFCYSGPESDITEITPPCQSGVQVCLPDGTWSECRDEIPPTPEQGLLACDLVDNDCDGCVDGTLEDGLCVSQEPAGFDVVFVIDTSGSMATSISAVTMAVNTFSTIFSANPEFRFGIVLAPGTVDGDVELYHDLSDFTSFETALVSMPTSGGGEEPQWDAVYELGTGELSISWREGTVRIIIVFTDERGQSYRNARGLGSDINEMQMCDSLEHGEVLATVTSPAHFTDFDDCGLTFELTDDATMMADRLDTIIEDPCR